MFAEDDGQTDIALLSETVWRSRFGADPAIVGRIIEFDDVRLRVIGVLGNAFRFPSADIAVWTPLHFSADQLAHKNWFALGGAPVLARLTEGVKAEQFSQRLDARLGDLPELQPLRQFAQLRLQAESLRERWVGERREMLLLLSLAAAVVLILLIANLVALWMGRCLGRARELALRSALGAGVTNLVRLLVAEIALLCTGAAVLGVALVEPGLQMLRRLGVADASLPWQVEMGRPALMLGLALAGGVALVLAAVTHRMVRRSSSLHELAHSAPALGGGRAAQRVQHALVGLQMALAIGLLAGGALLTRSFLNLLDEDLGFKAGGVMVVAVDSDGNDTAADPQLDALLGAISGLPGVTGVSFSSAAPFSGTEVVSVVQTRESADREGFPVRDRSVGSDYLDVLGLPLLRGRGFAAGNAASTGADPTPEGVLVDQQFVRKHLGESDPLEAELNFAGPGEAPVWLPVLGVVPTVRHAGIDEQPDLGTVYGLARHPSLRDGSLLVRSDLGAAELGPRLRALASAHGLRVRQVAPLDARIRASVDDRLHLLVLVTSFALCSAVLAAFGLFAVVALAVRVRHSEFALRRALGASMRSIAGLALRAGLRAALPGLMLGMLLAVGIGRVLAAHLHRVEPWDGPSLLVVAALGIGIALAACLFPARRAAAADPMTALRYE